MKPDDRKTDEGQARDPGRTPGQAEGLDEGEEKEGVDYDPGRTPGQAEGEDEDRG